MADTHWIQFIAQYAMKGVLWVSFGEEMYMPEDQNRSRGMLQISLELLHATFGVETSGHFSQHLAMAALVRGSQVSNPASFHHLVQQFP